MKTPPLIAGIVLANLLLLLAVVNGAIVSKQSIVDDGRAVFLELAPVDPRSLMQGDYMILNLAINRDNKVREAKAEAPTRGLMVFRIDDRGVGKFDRMGDLDPVSDESTVAIRYRKSKRALHLGVESFFFQEGMANAFSIARFAELRVSEDGEAVLVGLRDEELKVLGEGDGAAEGGLPDDDNAATAEVPIEEVPPE